MKINGENKVNMQDESPSLFKENLKYTKWIFGVMISFTLLECCISFFQGEPIDYLFTNSYLTWYLTLIVIPYAAVNSVYLFKVFGQKYFTSQIYLIVIKSIGLLIGVLISSLIIEYICIILDVVDDDYISLGGIQFSIITSNIIGNEFAAILIGLPLFLLQANKTENKLRLHQKQLELNQLEQLKIQSELEALQAKINPHFLYNSLNSIVSLIHENPDKAEQMVLSLSDLFRYSVNTKKDNYATIEEELKIVNTYLNIELVRFENQLDFELTANQDIQQYKIPKFLIQPLIENAIKHGTSKIEKGNIRLVIERKNDTLSILLYDNGPDFPVDIDSGYGLKCTVDKLNILCPDAYSFQLLNSPKKHVKIELKNIFKDA